MIVGCKSYVFLSLSSNNAVRVATYFQPEYDKPLCQSDNGLSKREVRHCGYSAAIASDHCRYLNGARESPLDRKADTVQSILRTMLRSRSRA
jgi:hypothetical protein